MSEQLICIDEAAEYLTSMFFAPICINKVCDLAISGEIRIYTKAGQQIQDVDEITSLASQLSYANILIPKKDLQNFFHKTQAIGLGEQKQRKAEEVKTRHDLGRYTLNEAAELIGNNAVIDTRYILETIKDSAEAGEMKVYRPNSIQPYQPKPNEGAVYIPGVSNRIKNYVPTWYVEAFWDDLNDWLEKKEHRIQFRFANPNHANVEESIDMLAPKSITESELSPLNKYKLRRNVLDPAIDEAIKRAKSTDYVSVYIQLKEMAKDEFPPFTGTFNKDALCYTNDNDELSEITKQALTQRLKRRKPFTNVK